MATTRIQFAAGAAIPARGETFPELKQEGSQVTIESYAYDAATVESVQFVVARVPAYGSGNLTVRILWFSNTATTGQVVWGVSVSANTPEVEAFDVRAYGWTNLVAETTAIDAQLGAPNGRLQEAVIALPAIGAGWATGDTAAFRIRRIASDGQDTMAGDAQLVGFVVEYSDV